MGNTRLYSAVGVGNLFVQNNIRLEEIIVQDLKLMSV